jgi:hypothetical protein
MRDRCGDRGWFDVLLSCCLRWPSHLHRLEVNRVLGKSRWNFFASAAGRRWVVQLAIGQGKGDVPGGAGPA